MKTLILTAALSLLACTARGQDAPAASEKPAETEEKPAAGAWLGVSLAGDNGKVSISGLAPDGPAAKAGLKEGDIILRIGETAVEGSPERVIAAVAHKQPGEGIELRYLRGDKEETVKIELAERPRDADRDFRGEFHKAAGELERALKDADRTGVDKEAERTLTDAIKAAEKAMKEAERNLEALKGKRDAIKREAKGDRGTVKAEHTEAFLGVMVEPGKDGRLVVNGMLEDSPAAKAGLLKGDILVRIGDSKIGSDANAFREMIAAKTPGDVIALHWQRGDKEMSAEIKLAKRPVATPEEKRVEKLELRKPGPHKAPDAPEWHAPEGLKKRLRLFLDTPDARPRPGMERMMRRLLEGAAPRKQAKPARDRKVEDAVWNRVQKSVANALKESGVGPDVAEKAMKAIEEARRESVEKDDRRAKLEAEAAKLETEMQALKQRADKLREELNKPAE